MDIQKRPQEKLEEYFSRLVDEGFRLENSYQGIQLKDIEEVLRRFNRMSADRRDAIWCLLNDDFPSPFARDCDISIADGASTAQIGCYVGILMRHAKKLDREGRDYWLKPLTEIGALEHVTFLNGRFHHGHLKAKSPNSAYRLTDAFKELLRSVGRGCFDTVFEQYVDEVNPRLKAIAMMEERARYEVGISAHGQLILDSIDVYAKTFLPGYRPVFTDYQDGDRVTQQERTALEKAGIDFGSIGDAWPDAILYNENDNSLWFIEAVTSDGEADEHKVEGLKRICRRSGKAYGGTTTTYETWQRLAVRQKAINNLARETYVWIREFPEKQFYVC